MFTDVVGPALGLAFEAYIPVCFLLDESTSKSDGGRKWMQLHIYHALLDESIPWDVRVIHGRVTADNITRAVRESFYSGGYLWDEKFDAFIKLGATITMLMC